jgi:Tol biopolymer transport system component
MTGAPEYELRAASPEGAPSRVLARIPAIRAPTVAGPSKEGFHPVVSPDGAWLGLALTDGVTTNLWALSISDGAWRQLTDFGQRATFISRSVSWSSDGGSIYAALAEGEADVVLLAGLR